MNILWTVTSCFIGMLIGTTIGIFIMAFVVAARETQEQMREMHK